MATLAEKNQERWNNMHIPQKNAATFKIVADRLSKPEAKARYQAVAKATGVPWEVIAVIHEREASGLFDRYLGNGQPLNKKTTLVPKGRGPFKSWEEGAVDALVNAPPKTASNKDWSMGKTLEMLERYNGLGYANQGKPSPYIWSGTDQYNKGKYIADHVYDPDKVDSQLGCAPLLKFLGYGKASGGVIVGGAAGTVVAGTVAFSFWDHIVQHWIAYGLVSSAIIGLIMLMVYAHNHKEEYVAN